MDDAGASQKWLRDPELQELKMFAYRLALV
jgi:hypothetical protein